jgi:predicted GNAT family N-acyltransferase
MRMDQNLSDISLGYKQVGFSSRLQKLLAAKAGRYVSHAASVEELLDFSRTVRAEVGGLATDETLLNLREKNPTIFQVVTDSADKRVVGFNAQLPLTELGREAVISGDFDPSAPALEYVATATETVAAIYAWLIYSPRSFVAVTAALATYVETYASGGCSIFCRAANDKAYKVFMSSGYEDARLTYPSAPDGLLVAHAQLVIPEQSLPESIEVTVARNLNDLTKVIAIRAATYMSEQECPFDEEFDGNDLCGAHMIGTINGEAAGCIRLRFFSTFVKFERLAVRKEYRNSKLSFRLVRAAMRYAAEKGYTQVYGHARHDLVKFWETFGFRKMDGRPEFVFSDVAYCEMQGAIRPAPDAVSIGDSPFRLLRPEGAWHVPGPLEREIDASRQARLDLERLRGR